MLNVFPILHKPNILHTRVTSNFRHLQHVNANLKTALRFPFGVYCVRRSLWSHYAKWIKTSLRHPAVSTRYPAPMLSRQVVKEVLFSM